MKNYGIGGIIKIGDTMGRPYNLVELEFNSKYDDSKKGEVFFDRHDKHEAFFMMDVALKELYKRGLMVYSFEPKDVYFDEDNDVFFFGKVRPIDKKIDDKEEVLLNSIIGLSTLAFCSYLPSYDLKNGLLNVSVISDQFSRFGAIFSIEDKYYYNLVLVRAYKERKLPEPVFYSDYILGNTNVNLESDSNSNDKGNAMVKATQVGKIYADMLDGQPNGFGKTFFFACMVATMMIAFAGIALYFLK